MSYIDLQATLREWSYDPEQISVRKIVGLDGSVKIQMRVELGVLQLEAVGRPDGERPHHAESLLHHHLARVADFEQRNGTTLGYSLTPDQCTALRAEASLYYRRFVSLFVLEEYEDVYRDTSHNLGIFDLCREYALEPADRAALESYRPYVLMMDARARALQAVAQDEPASGLAHVNRGILHVRAVYEEGERPNAAEMITRSGELQILRELARQIEYEMPKDSPIVTRKALQAAIEAERFEEAARLRDALKKQAQPDA